MTHEIVLIINGGEVPPDVLDQCRVVSRNKANLGFAIAVNEGVRKAAGEWCLILNPDAYLDTEAIGAYFKTIHDYRQGAALFGGTQYVNGRLQTDAYYTWLFSIGHLVKRSIEGRRLRRLVATTRLILVRKLPGSSLFGPRSALN